jgi:hypothetical protein
MISPPSLMDDVDSVQAQISRTMLDTGDWVRAHIDGVAYLEKSPLNYFIRQGRRRLGRFAYRNPLGERGFDAADYWESRRWS